jgi:apolipoprotein N-acyltransferase
LRCPRIVFLVASLALSAAVTAAAAQSGQHSWLAWISLLPLFWAIRSLRPLGAALSGALWGGCLYALLATGATPTIPSALWTAALLTVVPGAYAASCSLLTRRIGFNALILGLGWIAVEIALRPLSLDRGLLAGTQAGGTLADWVSSFFGYALVALLLVCANASLISILTGVRLSVPACRSVPGSPPVRGLRSPPTFACLQRWTYRQAYPRAPPIPVAAPSRNLGGDTHWTF